MRVCVVIQGVNRMFQMFGIAHFAVRVFPVPHRDFTRFHFPVLRFEIGHARSAVVWVGFVRVVRVVRVLMLVVRGFFCVRMLVMSVVLFHFTLLRPKPTVIQFYLLLLSLEPAQKRCGIG